MPSVRRRLSRGAVVSKRIDFSLHPGLVKVPGSRNDRAPRPPRPPAARPEPSRYPKSGAPRSTHPPAEPRRCGAPRARVLPSARHLLDPGPRPALRPPGQLPPDPATAAVRPGRAPSSRVWVGARVSARPPRPGEGGSAAPGSAHLRALLATCRAGPTARGLGGAPRPGRRGGAQGGAAAAAASAGSNLTARRSPPGPAATRRRGSRRGQAGKDRLRLGVSGRAPSAAPEPSRAPGSPPRRFVPRDRAAARPSAPARGSHPAVPARHRCAPPRRPGPPAVLCRAAARPGGPLAPARLHRPPVLTFSPGGGGEPIHQGNVRQSRSITLAAETALKGGGRYGNSPCKRLFMSPPSTPLELVLRPWAGFLVWAESGTPACRLLIPAGA